MQRFVRGMVPVLAVVVILWATSGCSGGGLPKVDEATREKVLLYGNGTEPKGIDPQLMTGVAENHIISALFEGLINYHLTDDTLPEPGVAASWEPNEDASVWTFHLRPDALWSNGDPVVAEDFVYAYRRILTSELAAEYAQTLFVMKHAQDYFEGRLTDFSEVGVKAIDANTLEITLVGPTPYFLNMLKHYSWFPVHPPTIEAFGGPTDRSGRWTRPGNIVGNGPFNLSEWRPNQYLKVVKSSTYWDRDTTRLNAILFFPIEDDNTELRMFESGRLHYTSTVPTNDIPNYRTNHPELIHLEPYLGTYFYRVNVTEPPLDNPKVREALAWAIDRREVVDKVTLGNQMPATAMVPAMLSNYSSTDFVGYDPDKARALLAEAGYPGGVGLPPLDLLYNTSEAHKKIAEAVGSMWNRELGVDIRLLNKEWKVYLDDQSNLNYDLTRSGWIADYADPITFLELFTTGNGNNDTGWSNLEYDRLIAKAMSSATEEAHLEALHDAEAILMRELPILPLYWYTRIYLMDPHVKNWYPKALDNRPWKYIDLEVE